MVPAPRVLARGTQVVPVLRLREMGTVSAYAGGGNEPADVPLEHGPDVRSVVPGAVYRLPAIGRAIP